MFRLSLWGSSEHEGMSSSRSRVLVEGLARLGHTTEKLGVVFEPVVRRQDELVTHLARILV